MKRLGWILCLFLILMAPAASALEAGDAAPAFSAPELGGKQTVSLSAYRGKVVYLDFWASWCPPCLVSLPKLEELRQEFPDADFQVVAVNLDRETGKALRFLAKRPIGYPSASDPAGRIPEQFQVGTMPTSFLIDRSGVIRYVHEGFREADVAELRTRIADLVGGSK
jgi:peroxiredoxin